MIRVFPLQSTRGSFLNQKSKEKNMVTILAIEPVDSSLGQLFKCPWRCQWQVKVDVGIPVGSIRK